MKPPRLLVLSLALATLSAPALASNVVHLENLNQTEFAGLARNFVAAGSYTSAAPAAPLGVTGFDIGVGLTSSHIPHDAAWAKAGGVEAETVLPKLYAHKGLPMNIDIGASVAEALNPGIRLYGAEVRYAIMEGGLGMPALSLRGAMTRLTGVGEFSLDTRSIDLTVSKGILMFTPFAGVGQVWGNVDPHVTGLHKESSGQGRVFAGVRASFGISDLAAEVDHTGSTATYSIRFGFHW